MAAVSNNNDNTPRYEVIAHNNGNGEEEWENESSQLLSQPQRPQQSPRFLLGIFSHNLYQMEKDRRYIIRETYLSFYDLNTNNSESSNQICPLSEIINQKGWPTNGCQMAYTFVVGGRGLERGVDGDDNKNGTKLPKEGETELLNATSWSQMMLSINATTESESQSQSDILYLDIYENGEYGKSTTWMKFATLLDKEFDLDVDYIVKVDSDALLIPHRFFSWIYQQEIFHKIIPNTTMKNHDSRKNALHQEQQRKQRQYIYGGVPMNKMTCGYPQHDHCTQLQAPVYMGGALYLLSVDLAASITSTAKTDACLRQELFLPHEDMAMANYVYGCTNQSQITLFENPDAYLNTWKHPIKSPRRMKNSWRKFLTARKQRQQKQSTINATVV